MRDMHHDTYVIAIRGLYLNNSIDVQTTAFVGTGVP